MLFNKIQLVPLQDGHFPSDAPNDSLSFQMGEGFLDRQHHIYLDHFSSGHVLNACYAHAWDATVGGLSTL